MKAMIFAAGLGTRLKPITDKIPKALVEIDGEPVLGRIIRRLRAFGVDEIVINVHHFADQIKKYLSSDEFGVDIRVSDETDNLLDTGGGLVNALDLLMKNNSDPVLIHNVDILSNADLHKLMESHLSSGASTTLLVNDRKSSRKLLFDERMELKGWHNLEKDIFRPAEIEQTEGIRELAFSGIYIMNKEAIEEMRALLGDGKYSVMEYFLSECRKLSVRGEEAKDLKLIDIGKPATLQQASVLIKYIKGY